MSTVLANQYSVEECEKMCSSLFDDEIRETSIIAMRIIFSLVLKLLLFKTVKYIDWNLR